MEVSFMHIEIGSESAEGTYPAPLRFRLSPRDRAWHLIEEREGLVGGVFSTLAAAIAFVRAETQQAPGSILTIELSSRARRDAA